VALALAVAAVGALALAGRRADDAGARTLRMALAVYVLADVAVGVLGNYPVPLLGFGVSPALGVWAVLGIALAIGGDGFAFRAVLFR
jgi:hypothetical protein